MKNMIPAPAVPEIDFNQDMVIAVFAGKKPSTGFSISIKDIQEEDNKMHVYYTILTPPEGAMTAQVLTQPFHIEVVPRSSKKVFFSQVE